VRLGLQLTLGCLQLLPLALQLGLLLLLFGIGFFGTPPGLPSLV
jgi:hypothetical protein